MKRYLLLLVLSGITAIPLSGCMKWMHGMDHGPPHQTPERAKTVEKEIPEKDARLTLDVPSLSAGEETTLVLTASRIRNGAPLTGAKVTFLVERLRQPAAEHADYDIVTSDEREAEEVAGKGIYQLRYKFGEQGLYRITAHARIEVNEGVPDPLKIAIVEDVGRLEGRDNEASITPWMVVGGIGMAVMMLLMMALQYMEHLDCRRCASRLSMTRDGKTREECYGMDQRKRGFYTIFFTLYRHASLRPRYARWTWRSW